MARMYSIISGQETEGIEIPPELDTRRNKYWGGWQVFFTRDSLQRAFDEKRIPERTFQEIVMRAKVHSWDSSFGVIGAVQVFEKCMDGVPYMAPAIRGVYFGESLVTLSPHPETFINPFDLRFKGLGKEGGDEKLVFRRRPTLEKWAELGWIPPYYAEQALEQGKIGGPYQNDFETGIVLEWSGVDDGWRNFLEGHKPSPAAYGTLLGWGGEEDDGWSYTVSSKGGSIE